MCSQSAVREWSGSVALEHSKRKDEPLRGTRKKIIDRDQFLGLTDSIAISNLEIEHDGWMR